jgi:hypothetical protein
VVTRRRKRGDDDELLRLTARVAQLETENDDLRQLITRFIGEYNSFTVIPESEPAPETEEA